MAAEPEYTYDMLAACAHREVKQRERVYKRQIELGNMTPAFAAEQEHMMRAIASLLDQLADGTRLL